MDASRPRPAPYLGVAQMEARRTWNPEVAGSIPAAQTNLLLLRA